MMATKIRFSGKSIVYAVIALVMLNNVEHLAWVHHSIARNSFHLDWLNKLHSIIVVLIVEAAIMVMVFKGQHGFAAFYTILLFVLQLIYYDLIPQPYARTWSAIVYAALFTISIYYFSVLAAKDKYKEEEQDGFAAKYFEAKRMLDKSEAEMKQHNKTVQQIEAENRELAASLQQYKKELHQLEIFKQQTAAARTCDKCGQEFESEASRRSHQGKCKGQKNN